jgi:hypothetical protein
VKVPLVTHAFDWRLNARRVLERGISNHAAKGREASRFVRIVQLADVPEIIIRKLISAPVWLTVTDSFHGGHVCGFELIYILEPTILQVTLKILRA